MNRSNIIQEQLALILESEHFRSSDRRCRALNFIVQNDLAGRKGKNTAKNIAELLSGFRDAIYVRTLMQEVRDKLTKYYEYLKDEMVIIEIPIGRYWPVYKFKIPSDTIEILNPRGQVTNLAQNSPRSQKAQEYYCSGYQLWMARRPDSIIKAIQFFQQAIQEEHTSYNLCYAEAYAAVAECYTFLYLTGTKHSQVYSNAKSHAGIGIDVAPSSEITNAAFGAVLAIFERDWENAELYLKRSIEINPNYNSAHGWYSGLLASIGRNSEAIHHAQQTRKLDPLSSFAHAHAAKVLYFCRHYDDSIEILQRLVASEPYNPFVCVLLSMNWVATGKLEPAIDLLKRAVQITNKDTQTLSTLGMAYARFGSTADAKEIINELESRAVQQNQYVPQSLVAQIWVSLDQIENTFSCLEAAYNDWDFYLLSIQGWEVFDPIRHDPRFYSLLSRLRLNNHNSKLFTGGSETPA